MQRKILENFRCRHLLRSSQIKGRNRPRKIGRVQIMVKIFDAYLGSPGRALLIGRPLVVARANFFEKKFVNSIIKIFRLIQFCKFCSKHKRADGTEFIYFLFDLIFSFQLLPLFKSWFGYFSLGRSRHFSNRQISLLFGLIYLFYSSICYFIKYN